MRNAPTLLLAVAILWTAGCDRPKVFNPETPIPAEVAPFMGTVEERAARAPYSPPGWPLRRGQVITIERRQEVLKQFSYFAGISAPFWVGDMVFGAVFRGVAELTTTPPPGRRHQFYSRYMGHFPQKATSTFRPIDLPPHLRGRDLEELHHLLYDVKFGRMGRHEGLDKIWTEDRCRADLEMSSLSEVEMSSFGWCSVNDGTRSGRGADGLESEGEGSHFGAETGRRGFAGGCRRR